LQEKNGSCWWFTGVYGPHQDNLKSSFLHELREIRDTCVGPWIIGGDFNLIFREEDNSNSNINRAMLGDFRRLINSLDLKEIPLKGRRYTWSNQRDAPTLVKLDHVFCTSCWEDLFSDASLHSNATTSSDHCPLTLNVRDGCMGKRRFHFESFWPKIPGFLEVVGASWSMPVRSSCQLEQVSLKLKRLAHILQSWGHKEVGNVRMQLGLVREVLHRLEMAQDIRILSSGEVWLLNMLKQRCLSLASLERTIARLRSRIHYLKEGDANTKFFHLQACYRKKKNFISKLEEDGRMATNHDDM
jgi:hypothetical protein